MLLAIFWLGFVRTPSYEATANLLVTPLPQDDETFRGLQLLRDSGDPTRTVQTASSVVESVEAARRTAQMLGAGWSTQRVKDSVSIAPEGESNILAVTGTADDAGLAARLANTYTRQTLAVRRDALERDVGPLLDQLRARQRALGSADSEAAAQLEDRINQLENVRTGNDPTLSISQTAEAPSSASGAGSQGDPRAGAARRTRARRRGRGAARAARPAHPGRGGGAVDPPAAGTRARARSCGASSARQPDDEAWTVRPPFARRAARCCCSCRPAPRGRPRAHGHECVDGGRQDHLRDQPAATLAGSGERVILLDLDLRKADVAAGSASRAGAPERAPLPGPHLYPLLRTPVSLPSVSVLATELLQGDAILLDALYAAAVRSSSPRRARLRIT